MSHANLIKFLKIIAISCAIFSILSLQTSRATNAIETRIIGGQRSTFINTDFMVALINQFESPRFGQFCGGSLVKNNWVLTAAHCVFGRSPADFYVLIGQKQLSSSIGDRIAVEAVVIHDNFDPVSLQSDIALVKLASRSSHRPIKTLGRFSTQDKEEGTLATILGWGNTSVSTNSFPDDLQQISLPIVSNTNCNLSVGGVFPNMLCLGVLNGGKDTCEGDSGGPAFLFDPENLRTSQIGIVSFGYGCARPSFAGVYTRVSDFTEFISSTICSRFDTPQVPTLDISINGQEVTASWNNTETTQGYRLNYAPFPQLRPIKSIDLNQQTSFSATLPSGAAFYVAVNAYNFNCRSEYSNIESFIVP